MTDSSAAFDKAFDMILSFEGDMPRQETDGAPVACSKCFEDLGLQLDAHQLGRDDSSACPACHRVDGRKLTIGTADALARRYFVWGSIVRCEYGSAPTVQFNTRQRTSIKVSAWLANDMRLLESILGVGFFHYGPRMWMVGEVEPLKSLQAPAERDSIVSRILAEYPTLNFETHASFFRVRKGPQRPDRPEEYDSPPMEFAGTGRVDSPEVPVLYGSPDLQLCLHECRVSAEDELYVATLQSTRELKLLNLVALLEEPAGVTEFTSLDMAVHMLFLAGRHSYELTRHIARAARSAGFDGLVYPSYFSLLRIGAMPFETAYGLSARRFEALREYEQSKSLPNLALFGHPVSEGKVAVKCIDRVILREVTYQAHFGPVGVA